MSPVKARLHQAAAFSLIQNICNKNIEEKVIK
jgi:hypothetical protein